MTIEAICRESKTSAPVHRKINSARTVPARRTKNLTTFLEITLEAPRRGADITDEPTGTARRCPWVR
jgi:hypothetical protein